METRAIKKVFGRSGVQGGDKLDEVDDRACAGRGGGMESVACVMTIVDGVMHPTINYEYPDPECDLDYVPNEARRQAVRKVLSNSFGFGGQNACLVFEGYEG